MIKQDDMNSLYVYIFFINLEEHRLSYLQNLNTFEYSVMPVLSGRLTHIYIVAKPWLGGGLFLKMTFYHVKKINNVFTTFYPNTL